MIFIRLLQTSLVQFRNHHPTFISMCSTFTLLYLNLYIIVTACNAVEKLNFDHSKCYCLYSLNVLKRSYFLILEYFVFDNG